MKNFHYVYILVSRSDETRHYTGLAENLEARLKAHNNGQVSHTAKYRPWRIETTVENVIAEAVKFFNLNALSSPILVKVHFDIVMTMVADTLYNMLAQKLRGFQDCDAPKIYRHFVKGKANITFCL